MSDCSHLHALNVDEIVMCFGSIVHTLYGEFYGTAKIS